MFYHPHDTKFTKITKHLTFWIGLFAMLALFIFLLLDDTNIPQKEQVVKIDINNNVNICLPEDEKIFQKSFFDF